MEDVYGDGSAFVFMEEYSAGNFNNGVHAVTVRAIDSAGNEVVKEVRFVVDYCYNNIDGTTNCEYVQSIEPAPEPIVVEPSFSDPPYLFVWISSGVAFISIILMILVISAGMKGPKKKRSDDDYDDDDWMSEFIGTTQDVDMDSITNTTKSVPQEEEKDVPELEEEAEDDPFSVNVVQRKARRTKSKPEPEPEPEEDDEAFFGLDDDEFDDEEDVEEKPKPRRKVGRRPAPRNAPKRRPTRRSKSDD